MTCYLTAICFLLAWLLLIPTEHMGQNIPYRASPDEPILLDRLNVRSMDLRDVLRGIAHEYNLNLVIDDRIDQRVTVRLSKLPVLDALRYLCQEYNLLLTQQNHIYRISLQPAPEQPPPKPLDVVVADSTLSVNLNQVPLADFIEALLDKTNLNVIVRQGVEGSLSGRLQTVKLDMGLRTLLRNNGFSVHLKDNIYHIDRLARADSGQGPGRFWVQVGKDGVSLDVFDAPILNVLREIETQSDSVNLIIYALPERRLTARISNLSLSATLGYLFKGTSITYRREGSVYVIGEKSHQGMASTLLVRLSHLRPQTTLNLIPENIKSELNLHIVKEHNALLATGPRDMLNEFEQLIRSIDHPTPQIHIEALVIDFESSDLYQLGLNFGRDAQEAASARAKLYRFNTEDAPDRGFSWSADGARINKTTLGDNLVTRLINVPKIGRLPADFYVRLQAMEQDGSINIRSRPRISTLNGHTANISIGTTQYYLLRTSTPYQSPNQVLVQEAQRFEQIEANVKLEITPWVTESGEITAEIRPEFSTPVGEFDPDVAPTINTRVLESTVRLQDGETIILGGMIREAEEKSFTRIPILGHLPLLGRFFRNERRDRRKSELIIFITPHVFYGNDQDPLKWQGLRTNMQLSGESHPASIGYTRKEQ